MALTYTITADSPLKGKNVKFAAKDTRAAALNASKINDGDTDAKVVFADSGIFVAGEQLSAAPSKLVIKTTANASQGIEATSTAAAYEGAETENWGITLPDASKTKKGVVSITAMADATTGTPGVPYAFDVKEYVNTEVNKVKTSLTGVFTFQGKIPQAAGDTTLSDGDTTSPIVVNGAEVTPSKGDVYSQTEGEGDSAIQVEYVWDGSSWQALGGTVFTKQDKTKLDSLTADPVSAGTAITLTKESGKQKVSVNSDVTQFGVDYYTILQSGDTYFAPAISVGTSHLCIMMYASATDSTWVTEGDSKAVTVTKQDFYGTTEGNELPTGTYLVKRTAETAYTFIALDKYSEQAAQFITSVGDGLSVTDGKLTIKKASSTTTSPAANQYWDCAQVASVVSAAIENAKLVWE